MKIFNLLLILFTTTALLNWTTSSEHNTDFFQIERLNESNSRQNWLAIGQVMATGASSEKQYYDFVDHQAFTASSSSGRIFYRLKMVDIDQQFDYSPIRSVVFEKAGKGALNIYPNPVIDRLIVNLMPNQNKVIELFDEQGETTVKPAY